MNKKLWISIFLILLLAGSVTAAKSEYFKQFEKDYRALNSVILNYVSQKVDVTDFVYRKDLATFTFKSGSFYLLRHVNDRPTAAIFIGEGNCKIDPVIPNERRSLDWCSGDETIDEDFESLFIRFADDLDLKLAAFPSEDHKIEWREFNTYKQAQAEFYFKPVTMHEYDNYFQLLRSVYERNADGYFWVDFNRYVFKYDPSLPEPVVISFEHEGGQIAITDAVSLKKVGESGDSNYSMSDQTFPTTLLSRSGSLRLSGMVGRTIDEAAITLELSINRDSAKFISVFLHYNLDIDSVTYEDQRCDFWRRGDFTFLGVILPKYHPGSEPLNLTIYYHGKNYTVTFPFVKNPTPSKNNIVLYGSKDFDFFVPGKGAKQEAKGRFDKYEISSAEPYRHVYLQPVPYGFDTLVKPTSSGIDINFLKSDRYAKELSVDFTPDAKFETAIVEAFNYMIPRLGERPTTETMFVYPDSTLSFPGMVEVRQLAEYDELTGALAVQAGTQVARQWFGSTMKPASDRELWCANAFADYLGLRYALEVTEARVFFTQLVLRQHIIELAMEQRKHMPVAAGDRASVEIRTAKGSWIIHMLRYLMYDPERPSEIDFLKFVREFAQRSNQATFTNKDLVEIAEKYHGQPLDWFFDQWLFDRTIPNYVIKHETIERDSAYYVVVDMSVSKVDEDYQMPVWFRVAMSNENVYFHQATKAGDQTFELGPFTWEPTDVVFNEFYSILCESDVSKK